MRHAEMKRWAGNFGNLYFHPDRRFLQFTAVGDNFGCTHCSWNKTSSRSAP